VRRVVLELRRQPDDDDIADLERRLRLAGLVEVLVVQYEPADTPLSDSGVRR